MTNSLPAARPPLKRLNDRGKKCGDSTFSGLLSRASARLQKGDYAAAARVCSGALRKSHRTYRDVRRAVAGVAYELAEALENNDFLWEDFQQDPFWNNHSRLNRANCLRYALMYIYGSHQGPWADLACSHTRALMGLWRDNVSAAVARVRLSEVGFSGLKAASKSKDRARPKEPRRSRRFFEVDQRIGARVEHLQPGDEAVVHVRVDEKKGRLVLVATRLIPKVGEAVGSKPSLRGAFESGRPLVRSAARLHRERAREPRDSDKPVGRSGTGRSSRG